MPPTASGSAKARVPADAAELGRAVARLAAAIRAEFDPAGPLGVVGIVSRGEVLARRLADLLRAEGFARVDVGLLDITWYRDDLAGKGGKTVVRKTAIDFEIDDRPIVLVDDVLFTGRSVRAALDALVDFGRPRCIRLAVLVDRGGRELPIQADYVGLKADARPDQTVEVRLAEIDGRDEVAVS
jgi:pyrimidine operon attenuation protein/uracil phosphoribosyltransferase